MTVSENPGSLKRFRRVSWRFQETFQTPVKDLVPFVETIVSSQKNLQAGCLTVDQVVFEPKRLIATLAKSSLSAKLRRDVSLLATGHNEVAELLVAALSDGIDFAFVSNPKPFVIYADHDEYVTFYANTKSNLTALVEVLSARGYKRVLDYQRVL